MKLKKLFAAAAASIIAVSSMATAAFAEDSTTIKLIILLSGDGSKYYSEDVAITGSGTYTFTAQCEGEDPAIGSIYLKEIGDDTPAPVPDSLKDMVFTIDSFKVNDTEVALDTNQFAAVVDGGYVDVCFVNTWNAASTHTDQFVDGKFVDMPLQSVSVTITVSKTGAAALKEETAGETTTETETDAGTTETTPAPATGATAAVALVGFAVASAVTVVTKRK